MTSSLRLRLVGVGLLLGLFAYLCIANFIPKEERAQSAFWPDAGIRWGLDLQGGIHWVLGVDVADAEKRELQFLAGRLERSFEEDSVATSRMEVEDGELLVEAASEDQLAAISSGAEDTNVLEQVDQSGLVTRFRLTPAWRDQIRERTMLQVLEVMRRRIADPVHGIPDSIVTRQGRDRVLVQIPGGQIDRGRAHTLLKSTGFLEFKLVKEVDPTVEGLRKAHPELHENADGVFVGGGDMIALERDRETQRVLNAFLVSEKPDLTGDYLEDARVGFDRQQRPIVEFRFNPDGGDLFGDLTEQNIGRRLAIILDGNVYSAPTIQSRITTRGQITGRFSSAEAADLAVVLRAGSLAVPVVIEEERTVGPTLGQDSIDAGTRASILGLVLIVAFCTVYYRLSGAYASVALFANLILLIGIMSLFEATLTLPGIAGLVLTVGMAVDANVIVFERIREELAVGKTPRAAVATGFNKALWTVLDANITTLITALVLFEFGTGPIKGFAVTLSIGIVTSVFSALAITRLLFDVYPGARSVRELSI